MNQIASQHVATNASAEARLVLLARARSLRHALADVAAAREGGVLAFAVPNPEFDGLADVDLLNALFRDPTRLPHVPPGRIATLIGLVRLFEARLVRSELQLSEPPRSSVSPEEPSDRLLTPQEAARMLGVTVPWLHRRSRKLPFARKLSHKVIRYSEAGIRRYLAARSRS
jgi:predicted DNA-binding transcriptional regulator AlpA